MTKAVQDLMVEVERIRDAFLAAFLAGDAATVQAALAPDATLAVDPTGTTAHGAEEIGRFVADRVAPGVPADLAVRRRTRAGDRWTVIDEARASFTHDREMPWLLPGTPPTGRAADVDLITVVGVRRGRVTRARLVWDLLTLADQLGLDPGLLPRRSQLTDTARGL